MSIPEVLVLGDGPDDRTGLLEHGDGRRRVGGARAFQRSLHGGIGETLGGEQARTDGVDVGARIGADEIGQAVERALPRPAGPSKEMLREGGRVWADPRGFVQQASRLARGIEEPITRVHREGSLPRGRLVATEELARGIEDLDLALVAADEIEIL